MDFRSTDNVRTSDTKQLYDDKCLLEPLIELKNKCLFVLMSFFFCRKGSKTASKQVCTLKRVNKQTDVVFTLDDFILFFAINELYNRGSTFKFQTNPQVLYKTTLFCYFNFDILQFLTIKTTYLRHKNLLTHKIFHDGFMLHMMKHVK